jgi:cell division protein FtsB
MSRGDTAGRGPRAARRAPSRTSRSSTPLPKRLSPRAEEPPPPQRTALTARAAILALALASVMVAVAVPFKVWLDQRGGISSLSAQIHAEQTRVAQLEAQHQRWSDPSYVEKQAKKRLHYVTPGTKSYVVLGKKPHAKHPVSPTATVAAGGPWYSQLWQSMQVAGGVATPTK